MNLWFVVPARGRYAKTRVCLRQLARTCGTLNDSGIHATAVVVADDDNLDIAQECGFWGVRQHNYPLGRKWNDGYQCALQEGADFVVPLGSDDWVDPIVVLDLPASHEIRCSRLSSVVSEDGRRISPLRIWYDGGDGVRILPKALLETVGGRPADDNRPRAIDTSIMDKFRRYNNGTLPALRYYDSSPWQIVDWKSHDDQLNTYEACVAYRNEAEQDTWATLEGRYPPEALVEMRKLYQ